LQNLCRAKTSSLEGLFAVERHIVARVGAQKCSVTNARNSF